jgi:O-antigen ligase
VKESPVSQKKQKHRQQKARAVPPAPDSPSSEGRAEWFRRALLGVLTALVVARPLVLGEDSGMISPLSDTSQLVLTLLWFVTLLGWSLWRFFAAERRWYFGLVEGALLATALGVALSVGAANYRHPAVLISWEWIALAGALFLIRQLATRADDRRRVLAAMLASVVSVAVYGVYQSAVELPQLQEDARAAPPMALYSSAAVSVAPGGPLQLAALLNPVSLGQAGHLEGEYESDPLAQRVRENPHAFSTFVHPNTFASFLILFLPALAAAAWLRRVQEGRGWKSYLTMAGLGVGVAGLWVTHSRGAMLGLAVAVCVLVLLAAIRRWMGVGKAAGLILLTGVLLALLQRGLLDSAMGKTAGTARNRLDYWSATGEMIRDHPWLGVGPGNFSREYPRYMREGFYETISEPHNFALDVWATSGVFALLALLVAVGSFFAIVLRKSGAEPVPSGAAPPEEESPPPAPQPPRWEFYLGGTAGLLLGYVLRYLTQSPDEVLTTRPLDPSASALLAQGLVHGVRSVIWFAAFALFEGVRWPGRSLPLALATGVAAVMLNLCVSGGIDKPALAQPLWLAVGLALAALSLHPLSSEPGRGVARYIPVPLAIPVAAAVLVAYLTYVFVPVTEAAGDAQLAALAARNYRDPKGYARILNVPRYLNANVVDPLTRATRKDPGNARWQAHLTTWMGELLRAELWRASASRDSPDRVDRIGLSLGSNALHVAKEAQRLDPHGSTGYQARLQLYLIFSQYERTPKERRKQYALAADALRGMLENDPTNPALSFQLAQMLTEAGENDEARAAAEQALYYDQFLRGRVRQLNSWQRFTLQQQLRSWQDHHPLLDGE